MGAEAPRVLVIIPTYNELEALPRTLARLRAAEPGADVLVVDDASPDGTGDLADSLAATDPAFHVLHRTGKEGLGKAYLAGFAWGLERGYTTLVEMDADGSHRPEELGRLLAVATTPDAPDLVIGSRWVPGGAVENWPWHREMLSRGGNTYTRIALGLPVNDATAGFRAYRSDTLTRLLREDIASAGYCFQVDMAWRVHRLGGRITEVPILFVEREHGVSKMNRSIVVEALWRVTGWGLRHRWRRLTRRA